MKWLATWGIAAALIVAAWLISLVTPDEVAWRDGYPVTATIGQPLVDRNVTITVTSATIADELTEASDVRLPATGAVWVAFDISAQVLRDETQGTITNATLIIDGNEYRASDRVRGGLERAQIFIAAPSTGAIVFEIPEPLAEKSAELRLGARWDVDNADTYLVVTVNLADAVRVETFDMPAVTVGD